MSSKEISVFIIGLMLAGFLYLMKTPSVPTTHPIDLQTDTTLGIDKSPDDKQIKFNPATKLLVRDKILDIPAWSFDLAALGALTSEELVKSIQQSIEQKKYFQPENDNALFYLVNLKSIDMANVNIDKLTQTLTHKIALLAQDAISQSDATILKSTIASLKTLKFNNKNIKNLEEKLATINSINKLFTKGSKQILSNNIIGENADGAWYLAKQGLELDATNPKVKLLVTKVNDILINNALRAAEEIDFQLANSQIEQAQLLAPDSPTVATAQTKINELKQQRYIWLEQQISTAIERNNVTRAQRMLQQLQDLGLQPSQLTEYQNEIIRITTFGQYTPLEKFSDIGADNIKLPKMVVMPTGTFTMGSNDGPKYEKPVHNVHINYGFAVSQNEISVADFKLFMQAQDYRTDAEKNNSSRIYDMRTGRLRNKYRTTWQKDYLGKRANDKDPVIHVSWNDAIAYTNWLSEQTGKNYRLLTEAEFEYVLRAGSNSYYPWGDSTPKQIIENLTGKLDKAKENPRIRWKKGFDKYNDKYWGPAPTGSFISNKFSLNDTAGNVMEWVMDCWHDSYVRAPANGSSWMNPGCTDHVIRGGSWSSAKNEFASSHRLKAKANFTDARLGFRIAVDLK